MKEEQILISQMVVNSKNGEGRVTKLHIYSREKILSKIQKVLDEYGISEQEIYEISDKILKQMIEGK